MKKKLPWASALLLWCGCQQQPSQTATGASTDEAAPAPALFAEENVPVQGFDVNAFSKGIQHIGIPTTEAQKPIDFYLGLGFKLATRHDINGRDFAFVQLGNLLLEIIPTDKPAMQAGAVDHFCLDVENIDTLYAHIKEAGYTMVDDHIHDSALGEKGDRYFFILGPNNGRAEFCEIVK